MSQPAGALAQHGGQLRLLRQEFSLGCADVLDFSANINPDGPPPSVLHALQEAVTDARWLTEYPDLESFALREAFAAFAAVPVDSVLAANGFVPLLEAVVRTAGIRHCLLPVPCFGEYRKTLARCGVEVTSLPLQHLGFRADADALGRALAHSGADSLLLANPQNPAGLLMPADELRGLIQAHPKITFLLDEAFIDYVPEQTLTVFAARGERCVVFRSVTKFFAIPGMRVAFAIAAPRLTEECTHALPPWPITTLAEVAVRAALSDELYQAQARRRNQQRREELACGLRQLGVAPLPGASANFLLCKLPTSAAIVRERLLREHAVHARSCANFEELRGEYLRLCVRTEYENERLLHALKAVLGRVG